MAATWEDAAATWDKEDDDETPSELPEPPPSPPRSFGLYLLGTVMTLILLAGAALVTVPADALPSFDVNSEGATDDPLDRNRYLATLCGSSSSDAELAQSLCSCVDDSTNPRYECRDELYRWAVWRDVARCEKPEQRRSYGEYCRCVQGVARIVELADTEALARRRSHRYRDCRRQHVAPALPDAG